MTEISSIPPRPTAGQLRQAENMRGAPSRAAPAPTIRIIDGKAIDKGALKWAGKVAITIAGGAEIVIGDVMAFEANGRC